MQSTEIDSSEHGKVKVRARLRLYNEKMIDARKRLGLTMKQLSVAAGVCINTLYQIQRFHLRHKSEELLMRVAIALRIGLDDVAPPMLRGKNAMTAIERVADIDVRRLQSVQARNLTSGDPVIAAMGKESEALIGRVLGTLPTRERRAVDMRYGLHGQEMTLLEVAKELNVTAARAGQIIARGIRRLQDPIRARWLRSHVLVAEDDK